MLGKVIEVGPNRDSKPAIVIINEREAGLVSILINSVCHRWRVHSPQSQFGPVSAVPVSFSSKEHARKNHLNQISEG